MATRKKSIKVPVNFGNVADLANNTTTTIGTPTIYIPENSVGNPVTFATVSLFVAAQDTSTATGATVTTFTTTLTLSGATASAVSISAATLANTGENWGGLFGPIDYTAYFNTNYGTVTNKALTVQVLSNITTGTGVTTRGVYAYLEITYTYDDTAATRIQTVCIPYESGTGTLTTTANTTFATMPQLTGAGGWLNGYAGLTIRNRWIEIKGNCNNNGTNTDHNLSANFDSGTAVTLPTRESALASDTYQIFQVDASALTTTATHAFQLWNSLATRWANIIVNEWITFEFTVSGTTEVLNYLELPVEFNSPMPGTTSAVARRVVRSVNVQEPATLTMRKCSVELNYTTAASATLQISAGSQASYRAYAQSSSVVCGQFSTQHGLDSTSALGAAFTLARGNNDIVINAYRSAGSVYTCTGVIKLLYSSGVSSQGIDAHNHTMWGFTRQMSFATATDVSVSDSFAIPETSYFLNTATLVVDTWYQTSGAGDTFPLFVTAGAQLLAGEGAGAGWREVYADAITGDTELAYMRFYAPMRKELNLYPTDPDPEHFDLETARNYRTTFSTGNRFGYGYVVAYHSIASTVSGTISGSSGGTVTLEIYNSETNELYASSSRTGNGSYSFTVYDDVASYIVVAYESASLKGVSKAGTPASNFDISLDGGGGGGGEFFF